MYIISLSSSSHLSLWNERTCQTYYPSVCQPELACLTARQVSGSLINSKANSEIPKQTQILK
ncbi:MAG: hypothetical protein HND39_06560 [Ignavibacteriota bacterium]|nr:MAG: hypothetical protein HND39_06560 [Ignavibacteriota bacterium]